MSRVLAGALTMRRLYWNAILLAGAAGGAVWLRLALAGDPGGLLIRAYLALLGGLGLVLLLDWTGRELPAVRAPRGLPRLPRRREAPRLPELVSLENAVELAQLDGLEFQFRLRRDLAELAADRLAAGSGVDLLREPERAAAILGADLWELVRPDRPAARREDPGIPAARLRDAIQTLERI